MKYLPLPVLLILLTACHANSKNKELQSFPVFPKADHEFIENEKFTIHLIDGTQIKALSVYPSNDWLVLLAQPIVHMKEKVTTYRTTYVPLDSISRIEHEGRYHMLDPMNSSGSGTWFYPPGAIIIE